MKRSILLLVFIVTLVSCEMHRKHLAGLPKYFNSHEVAQPERKLEQSAFLRVNLEESEESLLKPGFKKVNYEVNIPVDESAPLQISFASPIQDQLTITLVSPSGANIPLNRYLIKENFPIGDASKSVPVLTYFLQDIQETGFYVLSVQSKQFLSQEQRKPILENKVPDGILIVYNYDKIEIETSMNSYLLKVGHDVGLHAQILKEGKSARQLFGQGEQIVISNADMMVHTPNGQDMDVPMHDDGLFGDRIKGDHVYAASVPTTVPGTYRLSAVLRGYISDSNGVKRPFLKTAEHDFVVSPKGVEINGKAWLKKHDSHRANINIGVNLDQGIQGVSSLGKFRAYTEVYGVANDGSLQPAAWLGSIVNVQHDSNGSPYFTLQFNLNWLTHSNLKGPITLKNTYLSDGNTQYPVTAFDGSISVQNSRVQEDHEYMNLLSVSGPIEITNEMKFGVNPLPKPTNLTSGNVPNLFLLHGYCSDVNPFESSSSQFTQAAFFLNANANENNDAFATKVYEYAQSHGAELFSLIGHSQGGMASLHLLNSYWSGLDHVSDGRRIQTIGTPWKGNSAAGSAASLGTMFGIGCGTNNDLTLDGAKNWATGIHEDHPQYVYFYTTTYQQGKLFGDYCNMAINAILQWPNDGVSESKYSVLADGNNMGNTQKWCHTTGMKYPAQYQDNTRNSEMNSKAGRS